LTIPQMKQGPVRQRRLQLSTSKGTRLIEPVITALLNVDFRSLTTS